MPVFSNRAVFEVARGIKMFFNLEAGITRAGSPESGPGPAAWGAPNEELKRLRGRVEKKDRELEAMRAELAEARGGRRLPGFSDTSTPVFFVLGNAKSGTSWLRRTLNSHPEILCRGEGRFFERDFGAAGLEDLESGRYSFDQPISLYGALSRSGHLKTWVERSVWTGGEGWERHLGNLTRLAVNYFLTDGLSRTGKSIVGDKTPFPSAKVVEEISVIYPEAKAVHMIRDGRDIAVSVMHHLWNHARDVGGPYDLEPEELRKRDAYRENGSSALNGGLFAGWRLEGIARDWGEQVGKATKDGPALLGGNYAEVRYEDLLRRPEEELGGLLRFLGADASERAVRRCIEAGSFERRSEGRKRGEEESSSFFRKGVAGDWKNVFTEEDKRVFKAAAGDALIKLGYERDNDW